MKLELGKEEVERVMLDWAQEKWPGMFNSVTFECGYSIIRSAMFSKEDPDPKKDAE